ncbi:MAG: hypothetical protein ABEH65_08985 [Halobacteriales archaeon]
MVVPVSRTEFPTIAASISISIGAAAVVLAIVLTVAPLPALVGVPIPASYRYILVLLAAVGGTVHLFAGWWAWRREDLFKTMFTTMIGMILLQVSVPFDIAVLVLLGLSREEFAAITDADQPD